MGQTNIFMDSLYNYLHTLVCLPRRFYNISKREIGGFQENISCMKLHMIEFLQTYF